MLRATRSELTRLTRRNLLLGWLGLSALICAMFTAVIFSSAQGGTPIPATAPGGAFPSAAELAGPTGRFASLGAAASILGVITMSFWAVAAATDYSTGLIRLLVQAEPRRLRLLGGKVLALSAWTAIAAAVAVAIAVLVSHLAASATRADTAEWDMSLAAVAGGWVNTFLALLVWGVFGLVIAVAARSSAVAISLGVAYLLVVEGAVRLVADDLADRLPGATLTALAEGGSVAVSYGSAVALGMAYATIGLGVAAAVLLRRDIVD